ncbi:MAG: hypothetical protein WD034_06375 [Parvibaculum sp.]
MVRADNKRVARLNVIRDLLSRVDYRGKDVTLAAPDRKVVLAFEPALLTSGRVAP